MKRLILTILVLLLVLNLTACQSNEQIQDDISFANFKTETGEYASPLCKWGITVEEAGKIFGFSVNKDSSSTNLDGSVDYSCGELYTYGGIPVRLNLVFYKEQLYDIDYYMYADQDTVEQLFSKLEKEMSSAYGTVELISSGSDHNISAYSWESEGELPSAVSILMMVQDGGDCYIRISLVDTAYSVQAQSTMTEPESTPIPMQQVFTKYWPSGTKSYSREEAPKLYEKAEKLLKMRSELFYELYTMSADMDMDQEIIIKDGEDENQYYLVDCPEITGWDYYEKRAEEIYNKDYVDNIFTPNFIGGSFPLYVEQDGHLYRLCADGIWQSAENDTIKISEQHGNGTRYFITGIIETDADPYLLLLDVQVNEDKPCGFEIISESELDIEMEE